MDMIKEAIEEWLREILVGGIINNLSGLFESVNEKVGEISTQVGMTPQGWNSGIFNMIKNLSDSVIPVSYTHLQKMIYQLRRHQILSNQIPLPPQGQGWDRKGKAPETYIERSFMRTSSMTFSVRTITLTGKC